MSLSLTVHCWTRTVSTQGSLSHVFWSYWLYHVVFTSRSILLFCLGIVDPVHDFDISRTSHPYQLKCGAWWFISDLRNSRQQNSLMVIILSGQKLQKKRASGPWVMIVLSKVSVIGYSYGGALHFERGSWYFVYLYRRYMWCQHYISHMLLFVTLAEIALSPPSFFLGV